MSMRAEDYGWPVVGGVAVGWEIVALIKRWPLLSELMDRYRSGHRILVPAIIIYFAGHLTRFWPRRFDPLTRLAGWLRGWLRR